MIKALTYSDFSPPLILLQVRGSILIGMACTALTSFAVRGNWPTQLLAPPSLRLFDLDFSSVLALQPGALSAVMAYVLVMVFDIGGAIYGAMASPMRLALSLSAHSLWFSCVRWSMGESGTAPEMLTDHINIPLPSPSLPSTLFFRPGQPCWADEQ